MTILCPDVVDKRAWMKEIKTYVRMFQRQGIKKYKTLASTAPQGMSRYDVEEEEREEEEEEKEVKEKEKENAFVHWDSFLLLLLFFLCSSLSLFHLVETDSPTSSVGSVGTPSKRDTVMPTRNSHYEKKTDGDDQSTASPGDLSLVFSSSSSCSSLSPSSFPPLLLMMLIL